jgi:purine nucleoside phosphorylase
MEAQIGIGPTGRNSFREAGLARGAEICYAAMAMVTDPGKGI